MKKIIILLVVGAIFLSGMSAQAILKEQTNIVLEKKIEEKITQTITIDIDSVELSESQSQKDYITINFKDTHNLLMNPGQPILPRITKHYELPFGANNIKIQAHTSGINEIKIAKEILPASTPLPLSSQPNAIQNSQKDQSIYGSDESYPHEWMGYHTSCGLNADAQRITYLTVNFFPIRYRPLSNIVSIAETIDVVITYDRSEKSFFPQTTTYNLVIITPSIFENIVKDLADHKNTMGVTTKIKTTEEIFQQYPGTDKPEQIKYFIKDAIEQWNSTYILLFGGLKSILWGNHKDDMNQGSSGWHVPVRYSNFQWDGAESYNFTSGEPGYISDLYYADIYKEGGEFDNWDSNGNGIYAEWSGDLRDELDLVPDVALGRLACRNKREARVVVDKIIDYESQAADSSWFNRIIVISGDGFLDQHDLDIQWDTTGLADGKYTIHAQSTNPEGVSGPIDMINITLDKTVETHITFNHDDHLNPALQEGYPALPIAEIVSISEGNILGNSDYTYTPTDQQAYCNDLYWWANISYIDGVLIIRGKSYDPKPYGNLTDIAVWITDETETIVFSDTRENTETYYEGEWVVGEKTLRGRGGALTYMPSSFEATSVFSSNGKWVDQSDVINEFSKGYGLAYFSGHGSPGWWGDHYPGIPGNRQYGQLAGLVVSQFSYYFPFLRFPLLPMRHLSNTDMLPVVCVGGCHNSMFSVSLIPSIMNRLVQNYMFTYGTPTPECWSWYMVKLPKTGAIATMGNTGYGWGSEGDVCTIGTGDGWINTEFFRQYGEENQHILGLAYSQTITSYVNHHKTFELEYWRHDYGWDGIDEKTVQQWTLLGDPSLLIGGYS